MVGNVDRAGFCRGADHPAGIEGHGVAVRDGWVMGQRSGVGGFRLAMELKGAGRADERTEGIDGRARLDAADGLLSCIGLARSQRPRICSANFIF
ncbi:hypothetical protein [Achromobacter xylosoxidans]|uniref:hypothetical protein n=1 Tax=Alcaligenes xylosoxydans xylosoxydans TaxID=85698 RepID=UPI0038FC3435